MTHRSQGLSARRPGRRMRGHAAWRGQVAIIWALTLVTLLVAVGLGIDGARLFVEGVRIQKAADMAALSASVAATMSGASAVGTDAQDMVNRNLPLPARVTDAVTTTLVITPDQHVSVRVQENNFPLLFGPLVGLNSVSLAREAAAKYSPSVNMGNPSATLGLPTEPITTYLPGGTTQAIPQNMRLAINGPDQWSESGDPYSPLYALSDPPVVTTTATMTNAFRTAAPSFNGYDYKVSIPPGSSGTTYIQVYDAETCAGNDNGKGDNLRTGIYGIPYSPAQMQYPAADGSGPYGPYPTFYSLAWLSPSGGQVAVPAGNYLAPDGSAGPGASSGQLGQFSGSTLYLAPTEGQSMDSNGDNTCDSRCWIAGTRWRGSTPPSAAPTSST